MLPQLAFIIEGFAKYLPYEMKRDIICLCQVTAKYGY